MKYIGYGPTNIAARSDPSGDTVTDDELIWMQNNAGLCPDCGGSLLGGPCGGMSENALCENCGSKFNIAGYIWVERIGKLTAEQIIIRKRPIFGISDFAAKHIEDTACLMRDIKQGWANRKPGTGRSDTDKVVLVPISTNGMSGRTATIQEDFEYKAIFSRRVDGEDPYMVVKAIGYKARGWRRLLWKLGLAKLKPIKPDPVNFAFAVMYSADTLLEDGGKRSGDYDWEVVAVIASATENEPMEALTMARNMLRKPGGTYAPYTFDQVLEAIYYWSTRVKV